MYINDLPFQINSLAEPILFADDINVIISNGNFIDFSTSANQVLARMIEWFSANKLVLNLEKNIYNEICNNKSTTLCTDSYKDKCIEEVVDLKFLGIQIDNRLNWRNHIDQIIPRLSIACYMVRRMCHICNNDTLRSIYFAYFHSVVSYGMIFWGNFSRSRKIFTLQQKIIRIMMGAPPRTSCRKLFKKLEILTVPSQYIYSLISFLIVNLDKFLTNSSVHSINKRNRHHLQRPIANLSCFQKGTSHFRIRIFNNLPQCTAGVMYAISTC